MRNDNEQSAILVVGASGDIGQTVARSLVNSSSLALVANRNFEAVLSDWSSAGDSVSFHKCDLEDSDQVNRVVAEATQHHGSIGGLVYAAGINNGSPLVLTSDTDWERHLQINLTGPFRFVRAVARGMMVQGTGSIVILGSVLGRVGQPGQIAYASSKSGLEGLVRVACLELAPYGVRVNLVALGPVATQMSRGMRERDRGNLLEELPLRQMAAPEDVVGIVKYLLSDDSSFSTGATFVLDGGFSAH